MKWFSLALAAAAVPTVGLLSSQRSAVRHSAAAQAPVSLRYLPVEVDGDGLVDAYAIDSTGTARLLVQQMDGSFLDGTEELGLGRVGAVDGAFWGDLTGDGRPELVVVGASGGLRLFVWAGVAFEEQTGALMGLVPSGVRTVTFEDYDANGWPDLGLWGGDGSVSAVLNHGELAFTAGALGGEVGPGLFQPQAQPGRQPITPGLPPGVPSGGVSPLGGCATQIVNQANSLCIEASSTPALGSLYPLSDKLFVHGNGRVGINTTAPTEQLEVAGYVKVAGIVFPDGLQTTRTQVGPQGAPGDPGPEGQPGTVLPAGTILMWGSDAPPDSQEYLLCDGGEYPVAQYPSLAVALGTIYGGSPGVTFRVPNMVQRFPMGATNLTGYELGDQGGSLDHTHTTPDHTHTVPGHGHGFSLTASSSGAHAHSLSATADSTGAHTHSVSGTTSAGGDHNHTFQGRSNSAGNFGTEDIFPRLTTTTSSDTPTTTAGNHSHTVSGTAASAGAHSHTVSGSASSAGAHTHAVTGTVGSGTSGDAGMPSGLGGAGATSGNNPPYLTVNFIIKT